jgi:hypothetical protein
MWLDAMARNMHESWAQEDLRNEENLFVRSIWSIAL